ncbi:hypothetical protein [Henriciella sp.]|uniref:hypothetical protein n=1 Tax=Henriciella sp. TaxID=1968823 RepID=UPI002637127E|nr:hypothetical protein [Henriciella sp.]
MRISSLFAVTACSAALMGSASAQADFDYHGFNPETIDALNERMEEPITSPMLEALSAHTGIEACQGDQAVEMNPPDGWDARMANANPPGGDVAMPIPTAQLAPDYPPLYEVLGVEGQCQVMFDVSDGGQTENVLTNCTLPQFVKATEDMINPLEFEAAEGQDSPATSNILLPINYCRPDKEKAAE